MVKAGDILKFDEPLYSWDKEHLDKGARYIAIQHHKTETYQTKDGWWHFRELEELEPIKVCLEGRNFRFVYGYLSDFENKFEVVGSVLND